MTEHIRIEKSDGILSLTMARPDKKNALTNAMYGALADAIEGAETDPSVRVLLIRGEGDMFNAGNDVGEFGALATRAPAKCSRSVTPSRPGPRSPGASPTGWCRWTISTRKQQRSRPGWRNNRRVPSARPNG